MPGKKVLYLWGQPWYEWYKMLFIMITLVGITVVAAEIGALIIGLFI